MERVGVLTGGGDCPGLNAVIRGVVRKALQNNIKVVGVKNGWKGLIAADVIDLDMQTIGEIDEDVHQVHNVILLVQEIFFTQFVVFDQVLKQGMDLFLGSELNDIADVLDLGCGKLQIQTLLRDDILIMDNRTDIEIIAVGHRFARLFDAIRE